MPELPEVETVRKTLLELVKGEAITKVEVYWPRMIKKPDDVSIFKVALENEKIIDVKRKGKFLIFELEHYSLVSHLRMEGKYGVYSAEIEKDKHTHVIFHFESGKTLRYHDVRKFGTMHLFPKDQADQSAPLIQLGPDPFETNYSLERIFPKIQKSNRVIKNILLDQTVIAGLGNIYVDETLFRANIHPLRKGTTLTEEEVERILKEAQDTLKEAIKQGGTTIRSYVNSLGDIGMFQQELFVYGQTGTPCKKCGSEIEKFKVSNRGTHVCPTCQMIS
ncbi:DNA-formamidopyrimidine glycosylase [Amphibacillus sp. Q70]|uniref:DNA-formamidopyrimidine glycosylase n=1 Tax=Amphibacillus sp. Q70 TaxID=3453416 RepID=UPI003F87ED4A